MTVLSLAGKVAIVTGAGRGLGRSMARGLARAGAKVVLTAARARDELDAAAAEIAAERGGASVATMPADVADPVACGTVVTLALERIEDRILRVWAILAEMAALAVTIAMVTILIQTASKRPWIRFYPLPARVCCSRRPVRRSSSQIFRPVLLAGRV